jgi:hypothetical protein
MAPCGWPPSHPTVLSLPNRIIGRAAMAVDQDRRNIVQLGAIELTFLAMMGMGSFGSFILQLGELKGWWF